jgi:dihydrofolate synthase/folylpolyglutamate synthase
VTPRERLFALEQFGIKLGLDNIATLLEALGRPDRAFASVHVAGTNGKGSVTAMVERGLRAAGHTTGRYTSPHLAHIEERVAIDGAAVDEQTFDRLAADVLAVVESLQADGRLPGPPTFFEATTAIAFEAFRRARVTAAVVEVGLGGRFDATNVITPRVTAITSIGLDHERHLGGTLEQIAFEKAGIIKAGVPVVAAVMPPEAHAVIAAAAARAGAPLVDAIPPVDGEPVDLALHGAHQRENAAVAVEILRLAGLPARPVTREHILTALTEVEWPARLEWLRLPRRDGDAGASILLDAAHNPAGARALAEYVLSLGRRMPLVIGVMQDKDVDAMVRALTPAVASFVATTPDSRRALAARDLLARIQPIAPGVPVSAVDDPRRALDAALTPGGETIVAGSIFLVGPLRDALVARGAAAPVRYPSRAARFFLK